MSVIGREGPWTAAKNARSDLEWLEASRARQHQRRREHEKLLRKTQRRAAEVKAQSWQKELELEIVKEKYGEISRRVLASDRPPLEALGALSLEDRLKFGADATKRATTHLKPLTHSAKLDDYFAPSNAAAARAHTTAKEKEKEAALVKSLKPVALSAAMSHTSFKLARQETRKKMVNMLLPRDELVEKAA